MSFPAAPSVAVARGRRPLRLCALLAALAVAGCGTAGLPSPAAPGSPTAAPSGTRVTSPPPSAGSQAASATPPSTPDPTPPPANSPPPATTPAAPATPKQTEQPGPPVATLVVGGGAPISGALGSYVWDGAGSDAPWIVPPEDTAVRARGPWAVTLVPPLDIAGWKAAWARVDGGIAGDPEGGATGETGPITVPGPGGVGTWSLQLVVRFADGNHAAWYWRVEALP